MSWRTGKWRLTNWHGCKSQITVSVQQSILLAFAEPALAQVGNIGGRWYCQGSCRRKRQEQSSDGEQHFLDGARYDCGAGSSLTRRRIFTSGDRQLRNLALFSFKEVVRISRGKKPKTRGITDPFLETRRIKPPKKSLWTLY